MSKLSKNHVVTVRFSDEEYEFLKSSVDNFHCDTISSVLRYLVRVSMRDSSDGLFGGSGIFI